MVVNINHGLFDIIMERYTALGSPILVPRKIALVGFSFSRASKPDLKSE